MSNESLAGLPKYRKVAAVLRGRIESGQYPPGSTLPSQEQLRAEFGGYAIDTIRHAIRLLAREGLVDPAHGVGVFVRQTRRVRQDVVAGLRYEYARIGDDPSTSLIQAMTGTPGTVDVRTEYREVLAPEEIAELFRRPAGVTLLLRRYLVLVDRHPYEVVHSYLPYELVAGTPLTDPANEAPGRGTMAQLAGIGVRVDPNVEGEIEPRPARYDEAQALGLADGVWVVEHRRVLTAGGRPVSVSVSVTAADALTLTYSVDLAA